MDPSIAPSSAPPIAPQQHDDLNVQIYEVKDPGENRFDQPMRSRVLGLLPEENASSLGGRKRVESDTRADAGVVKRHKRWIERSGAARVKLAGLTRLHNASQDPQPTPQPAPLSASQAVPVPVPAPASPSASSITATDASAPAPLPPKPSAVAMYCAYMQQFRPRRMLFLLPKYRESVLFMKRIRRKSVDSTVQTSTTLSDHVEFFEKWVNLRLRTFLTATNHPEKTLRNFFPSPAASSAPSSAPACPHLLLPSGAHLAALVTRCGTCSDERRFYLGLEILGHKCDNAHERSTNPAIVVDHLASHVATRVLEILDVDPRTTTPSEVDARNIRLVCEHHPCGTSSPDDEAPLVFDFRGAIFHSVDEHPCCVHIEYVPASDADASCARKLEARNALGVYIAPDWGCSHCTMFFYDRKPWGPQAAVVDHVRTVHGIAEPAEHTDFFFRHRRARVPCIIDLHKYATEPERKIKSSCGKLTELAYSIFPFSFKA